MSRRKLKYTVSEPIKKQAAIHEGAQYYQKQVRRSEVVGNYNLDVRNLITDYDRYTLVNKSRFFVENVPILKSCVEEIATYAIGESWQPVYQGTDTQWGKIATDWLTNWYESCEVSGYDMQTVLWLSSVSIDRDGDILSILTETKTKYPQIQLIPSHRIISLPNQKTISYGEFAGYTIVDGIIVNTLGRPIGYQVVTGDNTDQVYQVPVMNAQMIYEAKYPLQLRGFPSLATSINTWMDYRDVCDFEREAIKQAASVALIEKNEIGGVLPGQFQFASTGSASTENQPIYTKNYQGGLIRYFGSNEPNAGITQMENNRPGELTQTYLKDHVLRGAFASIGWPLEIAFDPTALGSAASRAILAKVERKLLGRQSTLFRLWKRSVIYALSKAIKNGYIPAPTTSDWFNWSCTYPKSPSIDLGRDAKTDIDLYGIGATTLTNIYGKNGEQLEANIRLLCQEKKLIEQIAKEYGVDPKSIQTALNKSTNAEVPSEEEKIIEPPANKK